MRSPVLRTSVAVATMTAGALLLSGCAAVRPVTELAAPVHNSIYPTVADAEGALPGWLPEDAAQIRVKASNSSDATIMKYTSTTLFTADVCGPSEAPPEPPKLIDSWSPKSIPEETVTCPDGWHAFATGDTVFAWTGAQPTSLAQ